MSSRFYALLELSPQATPGEIRLAYLRLASRYHPDRNPGDARAAERFRQIRLAYETLGDVEKRRTYDRNPTPRPTAQVVYPPSGVRQRDTSPDRATANVEARSFVPGAHRNPLRRRSAFRVSPAVAALLAAAALLVAAGRPVLWQPQVAGWLGRATGGLHLMAETLPDDDVVSHGPNSAPLVSRRADEAVHAPESLGQITLDAIRGGTDDAPIANEVARDTVDVAASDAVATRDAACFAGGTGDAASGDFVIEKTVPSHHGQGVMPADPNSFLSATFPAATQELILEVSFSNAVDLAIVAASEPRWQAFRGDHQEWAREWVTLEQRQSLKDGHHPWAAIERIDGWRAEMEDRYLQASLSEVVPRRDLSAVPPPHAISPALTVPVPVPSPIEPKFAGNPPPPPRSQPATFTLPLGKSNRRGGVVAFSESATCQTSLFPSLGSMRPADRSVVRSPLDVLKWRRRPAGEF